MRTVLCLSIVPLAALGAVLPNKPDLAALVDPIEGNVNVSTGVSDAPQSKLGKSFSLGQEANQDYHGTDAPLEMVRAHAKFTNTIPEWARRIAGGKTNLTDKFHSYIAQGDERGTISATPPPFYDIQYVVPVDIGTPPQRVHLNLDTGSADLWTFSSDTYQPLVNMHPLYRPNDSKTGKRLDGQSWKVTYGDGAGASGIVYTDRVALGDTFFDTQAVQSAVEVSYEISGDSFSSGILGLSLGGANTVRPTKQKTYLDNIKDELAEPLFTANLQKGGPGSYDFGYINASEYNGQIAYKAIENDPSYWKIAVEGYQIGTGDFHSDEWVAVVDTGTTMLLLPDHMVEEYYAQVKGAGIDPYIHMWTFPCTSEIPDFHFAIGSYRGRVPGSYINYAQSSPTDCFGGIQSSEQIGTAIIGGILLKSQFVVFDLGQKRLGFAAKDLVGEPTEPTPKPVSEPTPVAQPPPKAQPQGQTQSPSSGSSTEPEFSGVGDVPAKVSG